MTCGASSLVSQVFIKEKVMEKNKILKIRVGSHLYGTNTEKSDEDFSGIFIADEDYYFGLKDIGELDLSTESKDEKGKNTLEAVDYKLYEIKKLTRLALFNNPNIIEHLFVNEENILFSNSYADILLQHAHLFPNKGAYDKFIGYANSQKHKMIIKLDNFEQLSSALEFFKQQELNEYIVMFRDNPRVKEFFVEKGSHFIIGDLNFQKHLMVKKVVFILKERLSKITNRNELVLKHGYDTKFASHLIRLLSEGETLLTTGKLEFPLPNAEFILSIKQGQYELEGLLEIADSYEEFLRDAYNESSLPEEPRFEDVNDLIMGITVSFFKDRWR